MDTILKSRVTREADEIVDEEADHEQRDNVDMPDLKSEKSAEQKKKSKRTRTKNTNTRWNA